MPVERRTHVRFFLAFWLFVLSGVAFLDRTNISIAGLQISTEYGLGNQRLGWIFSAFLIGYAGFQVPAGWLAARFGPRRVLTIGVLWWGIATALTALLPSDIAHAVALLIAIRFALGAGEAVIYPAANQFVARWVPIQERGFINGLIFAGVGAGSGLTPPLLTWLITHHGWRAAFWFSALIGLAAGAVWWVAARDTPEEHTESRPPNFAKSATACHSLPQCQYLRPISLPSSPRQPKFPGVPSCIDVTFGHLWSVTLASATSRGYSSAGSFFIWLKCGALTSNPVLAMRCFHFFR